ncbi:probable E3 ubiquitin-protein ligase MID2 isoform X2 [Protopterus annectens]|uniref:probable E3 ubiquitin-protein ligase MID2 isoform X2 n=1 Tax=Protopterus annectens TaxID=7888 RepID=UPI001CFA8004|nr:probable E3 ubiquitin-protein ligase MID2 isoform X2 [Protopterus annectens]
MLPLLRMGPPLSKLRKPRHQNSKFYEKGKQIFLQQQITCPLCKNVYKDPVCLPCQHNFCRVCLNLYTSRLCVSSTTCPECAQTYTERGGVKNNPLLNNIAEAYRATQSDFIQQPQSPTDELSNSLSLWNTPLNKSISVALPSRPVYEQIDDGDDVSTSLILDIQENLAIMQTSRSKKWMGNCGWCNSPDQTNLTMKCLDCKTSFCDLHSAQHLMDHSGNFSHHNIQWIEEEEEEENESQSEGSTEKEARCQKHSHKILSHLCCTEWLFICEECLVEEIHNKHVLKPLTEIAERWRNLLPDISKNIRRQKEATDIHTRECKKLRSKTQDIKKATMLQCEKEFDEYIEYVRKQKQLQLSKIEEAAKNEEKCIHSFEEEVSQRLAEYDQISTQLNHIKKKTDLSFIQECLEMIYSMDFFLKPLQSVNDASLKAETAIASSYQPPHFISRNRSKSNETKSSGNCASEVSTLHEAALKPRHKSEGDLSSNVQAAAGTTIFSLPRTQSTVNTLLGNSPSLGQITQTSRDRPMPCPRYKFNSPDK